MNTIVDYLAFTVATDEQAAEPASPNIYFMADLLGISVDSFFDIGPRGRYLHNYTYEHITISQAYPDRIKDMGYHVVMTGQGCRYFETLWKDGDFGSIWGDVFNRLRDLTAHGYAVNISRLDLASDDMDGYLDLGRIMRCVKRGELASRFKSVNRVQEYETINGATTGRTIYFGSRQSNTFCRFYDKKAEQISRNLNNEERLKELKKIKHWIRMEFEFKDANAMKMANALCDLDEADFMMWYADVINGFVRFVVLDDANKTRCTIQKWWSDFLGTVTRASLAVERTLAASYPRLVEYYRRSLSTTVFTIMSRMSPAEFLDMTYDAAVSKLKPKHLNIINGKESEPPLMTSAELWLSMNPVR